MTVGLLFDKFKTRAIVKKTYTLFSKIGLYLAEIFMLKPVKTKVKQQNGWVMKDFNITMSVMKSNFTK